MVRHSIPKLKVNTLRRMFIAGKFSRVQAAKDLGIARTTVNLYIREFNLIVSNAPDKLIDMDYYWPVDSRPERAKELHAYFLKVIPVLILQVVGPKLRSDVVYSLYIKDQTDYYSFSRFKVYFFKWCKDNDICLNSTKRIESFTAEEIVILKQWKGSNNHYKWRIATILEAAHTRKSLLKTMDKVECCFKSVLSWIDIFQTKGFDGFEYSYTLNAGIAAQVKEKKENLLHLIEQSPKLHGFQKISWTTTDLAIAFAEVYKIPMSQALISKYLQDMGIRFRKAREVLTSPDPLFREKFRAIQTILENLGEKEKFFSIDEYGPFSVRPKGGRSLALPGRRPSYPQVDKGKGWFIMTAALELSTNQMTHFYSRIKDTGEMIKLIDLLRLEYYDQDKLYLSWDAASWHASKLLYAHIDYVNLAGKPQVALAPLPSCAQFLNVIESVFSGMSKSIIHNSDYGSVGECQAAIDSYYQKRNHYFLENPKHAGNIIWGKERVKPVFDKANLCRSPTAWTKFKKR